MQGVYFRETTKLKGLSLGLTGSAWNLPDKRVEIIAEGPRDAIESLVTWCWKGPEGATEVGFTDPLTKRRKVTNVSLQWLAQDLAEDQRQHASFTNGGKKLHPD